MVLPIFNDNNHQHIKMDCRTLFLQSLISCFWVLALVVVFNLLCLLLCFFTITSTWKEFTCTWKWQENCFLPNSDKVVQTHLYCVQYHLNLFLARRKLFCVEWIFSLSCFGCRMWSFWWLWWHVWLVEFSCLTNLQRCDKVPQHYDDIGSHMNILRCIDLNTLSHFNVIKSENGKFLFANNVYSYIIVFIIQHNKYFEFGHW